MKTRMGVVCLLALSVGACGKDKDDTEQLCQDLKDKVAECHLNVNTSGGCNTNVSDAVKCAARCAVNATCEEMGLPATSNAYYKCVTVCSGGKETDFICADGKGALPQQGVCDGTAQCKDASDEANCPAS